jgi:2-iminobutanoate/2-iminopropanoate deaminase
MDGSIDAITTDGAPAAIGPYSQAAIVGGWLFTSGQIGLDPETGVMVPGGVEPEAQRVLENLRAIVEAAGGSMGDVVKTTVYLADLGDFAAVNRIYAEHFAPPHPARACVQVAGLPKDARVEIDAVAKIGHRHHGLPR